MRKGHSILGLQVISQESAKQLGKVLDLVFDHDADECVGLVLKERGFLGIGAAQVVPWSEILSIGKDAVIVKSDQSVVNPAGDERLQEIMERDAHLSGTRIVTEDGRDVGTFAEIYVDENTGKTLGYEVSGGFISDTMSGKRYIPAAQTDDLRVGQDVLLAAPGIADEFDRQATEEPGGLKGAYSSAKDKATDTYDNIAQASVDQQKAFVVGKTAGKDVALPAPAAPDTSMLANSTNLAPATHGSLLISQGQTITQDIADRAEQDGILAQLLLAVGASTTSGLVEASKHATSSVVDATKTQVANAQSAVHDGTAALSERAENSQSSLEEKAIGQQAGRDVELPNGSTLVAAGMVITREMMETAKTNGKENELVASAGLGTISTTTQDTYASAKETAGNMLDSLKAKLADITGSAQEKKAQYDEAALQNKINHALGRPITRLLLAKDDSVILNTGDIITNKAVELARQNDVLDVLLDSVYDSSPDISPEMLRATQSGVAALPEQPAHPGRPETVIVGSDQQSSEGQQTQTQNEPTQNQPTAQQSAS